MPEKNHNKKHFLLALKTGIGCSLAILVASGLQLDNPISAGTITLLSLLATKWETLRLSAARLVTFGIAAFIAWVLFLNINNNMAAFGIFVFLTVLIAEQMGWRATISVNTLIGAHLLISHDFSAHSIFNELVLVIIGLIMALVLNLYQDNHNHKKDMIADMDYTEEKLQWILQQVAVYLRDPREDRPEVWNEIHSLDGLLREFVEYAHEYQENTFQSHAYYIDYFEMRHDQCLVLESLHSSMSQIRSVPAQAAVVADYIDYLTDYVVEKNDPHLQEKKLEKLIESMKEEDLPKSRAEFESRAILFHILMDLQSFLHYKRIFVDNLDEKQRERYWKDVEVCEKNHEKNHFVEENN